MAGRAIIVHSLDHALAALAAAAELGAPVTLLSPPGAAAYMGAGYFQALIDEARAEYLRVPVASVLDCGEEPGLALAALRQGLKAVRFSGPAQVADKIARIAGQMGAELVREELPALDLLDVSEPRAACLEWLEGESS